MLGDYSEKQWRQERGVGSHLCFYCDYRRSLFATIATIGSRFTRPSFRLVTVFAAVDVRQSDVIFLQLAKESAFMNTEGLCCSQTAIAMFVERLDDGLLLGNPQVPCHWPISELARVLPKQVSR